MTTGDGFGGMVRMMADPSDVMTNIPGILGYYPKSHIVLVTGGIETDPRTGLIVPFLGPMAVCKADVPPTLNHEINDLADHIREFGCSCVSMFVVDQRWGSTEHTDIASTASDYAKELAGQGISMDQVVGVSEIFEGEPITDIDCELVGIVGKPNDSRAARRLHSRGEVIAGSEEVLLRRFAPVEDLSAEKWKHLAEAEQLAYRDVVNPTPISIDRKDVRLREYHDQWLELVEQLDCGNLMLSDVFESAAHARIVARMQSDVILRDMMIAHIDGPQAETIRALWLATMQHFRGFIRCNALACYAIDRINRGATNVAKWALRASDEEIPEHSLTCLLEMAMSAGIEDKCLETIKQAAQEVVWMTCGNEQ